MILGPVVGKIQTAERLEPLVKAYASPPPVPSQVNLEIDLSLRSQPVEGPLPPSPQFAMTSEKNQMRLRRADAEGVISFREEGRVRAIFTVLPYPGTIDSTLRLSFSAALIMNEGLLLHASAVVHQQSALLFTGPSGAGKSTTANFLAKTHKTPILADELTALVIRPPKQLWALSTPFAGRPTFHPAQLRVARLYKIVKDSRSFYQTLVPEHALTAVLENTLAYVGHPQLAEKLLKVAHKLAAQNIVYTLHVALDSTLPQALGLSTTLPP